MPTVKDLSDRIGLLGMCPAPTVQGNGWMAPPDLRRIYSRCLQLRSSARGTCPETSFEVRAFGAPTLLSSRAFRYRLGVPKKPNYKCDWKLSTFLIELTAIGPIQILRALPLHVLLVPCRCELCSWRLSLCSEGRIRPVDSATRLSDDTKRTLAAASFGWPSAASGQSAAPHILWIARLYSDIQTNCQPS